MGRTVSLTDVIVHNLRVYDDDNVVDDLIRLSVHSYALQMWKTILERNNVEHCRYLSRYDGSMSEDLILWLCSLDYSNGTVTLLHVVGQQFLNSHVDKFLLLGNVTAITDDHMINGSLRLVYQSLLSKDMLQYLKLTEKSRSNHSLYNDHIMSVCNMLLLTDIPIEDIMYIHYYMSVHSIDVPFAFTRDRMIEYADYMQDRGAVLTNIVNSQYYKEILEHLISNRKLTMNEMVDDRSLLDTRMYSPDCYEYIRSQYTGPNDIDSMDCRFVNGVHLSVYLQCFQFDVHLSVANLMLIEEYIKYNYIVYNDRYYLCWNNMSIDAKYIETLLECMTPDDEQSYVLEILTSNVHTPIARQLRELSKMLPNLNINITYDYYNTPSHILYDFVSYGYYDERLQYDIIRNNHTLLRRMLQHTPR